jgi:prevent-host-death family protein
MKTKSIKYPSAQSESMALKEVTVAPGIGEIISVRSAKAHLSALLDLVAGGHEITITSNGKPKARLVSAVTAKPRKVFQGMGDYLLKQPVHGGPPAEEIIREDRDARGW